GELSVARFTAPISGSYSLGVDFEALARTRAEVVVLRNGTTLSRQTLTTGHPYGNWWTAALPLQAGDQLEIAAGGSRAAGNVLLYLDLYFIPELDPTLSGGLVTT